MKPTINVALRSIQSVRESVLLHANRAPGCTPLQHNMDEFFRRVYSIADKQIKHELQRADPSREVLSAFDFDPANSPREAWILDAICGKENFVRGIRHYCAVLGYIRDSTLQHAVIVDYTSDQAFYGSRTEKSFSPMGSMRVSDSHDLSQSIVAMTDVDSAYQSLLYRHCGQLRQFGCYPLDLIALGCKQVDIICGSGLTPFEVDLTNLLVPSFGAVCGDWSGGVEVRQQNQLLAANSQLFRKLVRLFRSTPKA